MRVLAEADATVEEKERAFRQWLDEHPNATLAPERICRNCEYWDAGGEIAAKVVSNGDCLNSYSPRFQTDWEFTCPQFYPGT